MNLLSNFKLTNGTLIRKSNQYSKSIEMSSQSLPSVRMLDHAPYSIPINLELKGYTKVSAGIDLITLTECKALQAKVEDLINKRDSKDPRIKKSMIATYLGKWQNRMQAMKIEEELVVLQFDKKTSQLGKNV